MQPSSIAVPMTTTLLTPPYRRPTPLPHLDSLAPSGLPGGTLLVLGFPSAATASALLPRLAPPLRTRLPSLPLVVRVERASTTELVRLVRRSGRLHLRAVLIDGELVRETLHRVLTEPEDLPREVVEWLALGGIRLSPSLRHLVTQIFTHAPEHGEVGDLLRAVGAAETTARYRLRKKGLPPPRRWLQAARGLRAALRIQAEPGTSLFDLALDLGYGDHSALSQSMMRTFRLRPNAIRGTLGWEWLLHRWLETETTAATARMAS